MNTAWPQFKPDDTKALHSYSLFLIGCKNAMQDVDQLQEMEHRTNLRIIISKLPYKMREKKCQEQGQRTKHRLRIGVKDTFN